MASEQLTLEQEIQLIQDLLGKHIKKPVLAEKHLARPPFRFLHDIIIAVMTKTGFYKGLFTPSELDSSNLNSREEKAEFLQKVIDVTVLATGKKLDVKVSKILAGQEPEKTNAILVALAQGLEAGINSDKAVSKVIGGGVVEEKPTSKEKEPKKGPSKSTNLESTSKDKKLSGSTGTLASKPKQDAGSKKNLGKTTTPAVPKPSNKPTDKATGAKPSTKQVPQATSGQKKPSSKPTKPSQSHPGKANASPSRSHPNNVPLARKKSFTELNGNHEAEAIDEVSKSRRNSFTQQVATAQSSETSVGVKNEEDSMQFMGEVESILQEHGIEIGGGDAEVQQQRKGSSNSRIRSSVKKSEVPVGMLGDEEYGGGRGPRFSESLTSNLDLLADESHERLSHNDSGLDDNDDDVVVEREPRAVEKPKEKEKSRKSAKQSQVVQPLTRNELRSSKSRTDLTAPIKAKEQPQSVPIEEKLPPRPLTSKRQGSATPRPASARPAAPRPKTAIVIEEETPSFKPPPSKIPVILDSDRLEEDEEDIVAEESANQNFMDMLTGTGPQLEFGKLQSKIQDDSDSGSEMQKGHLVDQILETKKDLESYGSLKLEHEDFEKLRSNAQNELEKLKGLIQNTARVANPLGKLMDFVQEDLDTMLQDYQRYKNETKKLREQFVREKEKSRYRLLPYRKDLIELEDRLEILDDEIEAVSAELIEIEDHFENYADLLEEAPTDLPIPKSFIVAGKWELDLTRVDDMEDEERKAVPRAPGPFGAYEPFLNVSWARKNGTFGVGLKTEQFHQSKLMSKRTYRKPVAKFKENNSNGFNAQAQGFGYSDKSEDDTYSPSTIGRKLINFNNPESLFKRQSSSLLEPPEEPRSMEFDFMSKTNKMIGEFSGDDGDEEE